MEDDIGVLRCLEALRIGADDVIARNQKGDGVIAVGGGGGGRYYARADVPRGDLCTRNNGPVGVLNAAADSRPRLLSSGKDRSAQDNQTCENDSAHYFDEAVWHALPSFNKQNFES
jgi:hypothetical protein